MSSNWSRTFQLGANSLGRTLLIVEVAFEFLTLFGLLGLFLGVIFVRVKRRNDLGKLPVAAMLGSQLSFMGYVLIEAIDGILVIRSTTVTGYFYISEIIEEFCKHVTFCLLFYVFFELAHRFHQRTVDSTKRSSQLKIFLWASLAIIVALSIVDWAYYIYLQDVVVSSPFPYFYSTYWTWAKIAAARCIVFLVVSVGIVSQAIFMTLRMKSRPLKISAYLLLLGAIFFFAWNLLWAIWAIRWYLASNIPNTIESTYMAQAITQCFLCLGTYLGLVLYCSKYREQYPNWDYASQGSMPDTGFSQTPTITELEASRAIFEADTKHPVPEVDTSRPIVEADASKPIVEADVSGQIVEADSQQVKVRN